MGTATQPSMNIGARLERRGRRALGLMLLTAPTVAVGAPIITLPIIIPDIQLPLLPLITPNVTSLGGTLGQVCGTLAAATGLTAAQLDLAQQCAFFSNPNSTSGALGAAYTAIVGQQLDALAPQVRNFAVAEDVNLGQRLAQLRQEPADQGVSLSGLNLEGVGGLAGRASLTDLLPLGAGAGSPGFLDGRLGLFVNGDIKDGSKAQTDNSFAFGVRNTSVTAGVDYRFTGWLVAGLAYSGGSSHFQYADDLGRMDLRDNGVSLYASIYARSFYLDVLAGYSQSILHEDRHLSFTNTTVDTMIEQYAIGETQLHNLWAGLSAGDELNWRSLFLNPEVSLTWHQSRLDPYTEAMSNPTAAGNGLALSYAGTVLPSLQARVGLRLGATLSTPWGVLQPQIHGAWISELRTAADTFTAHFAAAGDLGGDADAPLYLQSDAAQHHYFSSGAGLHATLPYGLAAFFDYERLTGLTGISSHEVSFGVRYQPGG